MSFVPAPQQANAAGSKNAPNAVTSSAAAPAAEPESDRDLLFKLRTFDVYWVEKQALMYRDGIDKVSERIRLKRWGVFFREWDMHCKES